jgi:hypothetical protein
VIQGTRGLVNLAVHIHNILFAIPKLWNLRKLDVLDLYIF